jgi:hypothetical protein
VKPLPDTGLVMGRRRVVSGVQTEGVAVNPATARARRVERVQTLLDDSVEPEAFRFFQGLLIALAISALLWAALAALGYGAYVLITTV